MRDGIGAIDTGLAGSRPNVGAHEVGHALGLRDLYRRNADGTINGGPAGNLMSYPHGTDLTEEQCKTIWENIDKFGNC